MRTPEGTTIWYLRVIHHIAQSGDVWTLDIQGEEWGEVDFPPDVEAARELTARWDAAAKAAAWPDGGAGRIPVGGERVSGAAAPARRRQGAVRVRARRGRRA